MSVRRLFATAVSAVALTASVGSLTPAGAIVGGTPAAEGAYPFMAALVDDTDFQFCGGSVIASTWVLTAAHCTDSAKNLYVITGRTNLASSGGQRIAVTSVHKAPGGIDALLLRLSTPTTSAPIKLAAAADDVYERAGTPVRATGWGDMYGAMGLLATNQMRQVDLNIVSDGECGQTNFGFNGPTEVCAAALLKDTCQGDSGGPLFTTTAPTRTQLGIVSYGTGCGLPRFPGVYAEVNNPTLRTWITNTAGV